MKRDVDLSSLRAPVEYRSDLPHERLSKFGAQNLGNTELIALLLGSLPGIDNPAAAMDLTRRLLGSTRSLGMLSRCDVAEFMTITGMPSEQSMLLVAAFELGRRVARENVVKLTVDSPEIVCQLLAHEYRGLQRESLRVLLLDTKKQLLRIEEITRGSLTKVSAHPRDIFRPAVVYGAQAVILTHNHPSGDPTPSPEDKIFTWSMIMAGKTMGVEIVDHVIIGKNQRGKPTYYSFKEENTLY